MCCSDVYHTEWRKWQESPLMYISHHAMKHNEKPRNKIAIAAFCVNLKRNQRDVSLRTKQAIPSDHVIRVPTTAARALMCFSDLSNSWSAVLGQSQSQSQRQSQRQRQRTSLERELPCRRNTETWRLWNHTEVEKQKQKTAAGQRKKEKECRWEMRAENLQTGRKLIY